MPSMRLPDVQPMRPLALRTAPPYNPAQDSFDFRRTLLGLWRSVRRHLLLIAATTMLTVSVGVAYIVIWPPIYTADVLLAAETEKDVIRAEFYQSWHVFRKNPLADEVQLFTAPSVLSRVVDRLDLTYDDIYHPFMSHVTYLWGESTVGKAYRRVKAWVFPPAPSPYAPTPEEVDRARTIGDFRSGVAVESASDSGVGRLVVRGPSPRVAEIANTVVDVYLEMRIERQRREADRAYAALSGEASLAREELRAAESKMEQYYTENGILFANEKDKLELTRVETLRAAMIEIESGLAINERTLVEIEKQLAAEEPEIVSARIVRINPVRESLTDKLSQMTLQRSQMLINYRGDSPEIRDVERQIAVIRAQLGREATDQVAQKSIVLSEAYESLRRRKSQLEADIAGQRAGLEVKRAEEARLSALVAGIPQKMKRSHELERDRLMLEKRYSLLQEKLMIAAVSRAMASTAPATIQVIDRARPPDKPVWPQTKLVLGGAVLLGIFGGIGLAVLLDLMSGRVDRYRVASGESGMDIYAILPPDRRFAAQAFPINLPRGNSPPTGGT